MSQISGFSPCPAILAQDPPNIGIRGNQPEPIVGVRPQSQGLPPTINRGAIGAPEAIPRS